MPLGKVLLDLVLLGRLQLLQPSYLLQDGLVALLQGLELCGRLGQLGFARLQPFLDLAAFVRQLVEGL